MSIIHKIKNHSHLWHKAGVFLSALCLVHCLAMPILVTVMPLFMDKYFSHSTEIYLVIGSLLIAVYLLQKDYKIHHNKTPFILMGVAAILQVSGLFFVPHELETFFVVGGSLLLLTAYLLNFRFHSKYCTNHEH